MTRQSTDLSKVPHRRRNALTGEWLLVSPHRTQRPWQGAVSEEAEPPRPRFDPECYLCPGNKRAKGAVNPLYAGTFAFTNDFPALFGESPRHRGARHELLAAQGERGICRVVIFSPRHDLTLADMTGGELVQVVKTWQEEFRDLSSAPHINYVQIFENKGSLMGNSNPHPHCQIWAQESIPNEPMKETRQFRRYFARHKRSLLGEYLKLELRQKERIVYENSSFVVLVPYWAVWPYETMIVSRRKLQNLLQLTSRETDDFADAIKAVAVKYDNLFSAAFPYSAGLHQAPTDAKNHPEWHFHMHFLPPLLRSASVRKFMVGYEMLAEPQRDILPETSARILRDLPRVKTSGR